MCVCTYDVYVIHVCMYVCKAVPLHAMEALGGRGGIASKPLLILDLGTRWGWVVSVTLRPRLNPPPRERTPSTHCTGRWVGPRAGLDTEDRGKILCPRRVSNPDRPVVQPVVRHYTAWANPAPMYVCIYLFIYVFIQYDKKLCEQLHNIIRKKVIATRK
jgi:hypothetical protein